MLSGALIKLPDDLDIKKLDGVKWEREHRGRQLTSVIQFQESFSAGEETAAKALVIHQSPGREAIIDDSGGKYSITYIDSVDTTWANIFVVPGFVVVDSLENRAFVREIINRGLKLTNPAHEVALDTAKMAQDHVDQWIRGFSGRLGRVDRGTVFGEGVEQDSIFGPELGRSTSKIVGWTSNFFGSPVKVRVSPRGSVTLWAFPPPELLLRFIRVEILPYMISLP
jgi:hypothetical protein